VNGRERFVVTTHRVGDVEVDVVRIEVEVDLREAGSLRDLLISLDRPAVADLTDCVFMGSDGLRALLEGKRAAAERQQRLVLAVAPGTPVARLLELVAGRTLFNIQPTVEAALEEASIRDQRAVPDRRAGET
jgi:anti-anti-sigma factor